MKIFLPGKQDKRIMKVTSELADKCLICILEQIDHLFILQKRHNLLLNVNQKIMALILIPVH